MSARGELCGAAQRSGSCPLWVTSDRTGVPKQCPLLLQERTFRCVALSVALGQKRTHALQHDRVDSKRENTGFEPCGRLVPAHSPDLLRATRARQNDPNFGERTGLRIDLYGATMLLDDNVVTDGQA
jgi:hypothetical protein